MPNRVLLQPTAHSRTSLLDTATDFRNACLSSTNPSHFRVGHLNLHEGQRAPLLARLTLFGPTYLHHSNLQRRSRRGRESCGPPVRQRQGPSSTALAAAHCTSPAAAAATAGVMITPSTSSRLPPPDPAAAISAAHRDKWVQYYAHDPKGAPWDTHAVSSQLRRYLRACCSAGSVTPGDPTAAPASALATATSAPEAAERPTRSGGGSCAATDNNSNTSAETQPQMHVCQACAPLKPWLPPQVSPTAEAGTRSSSGFGDGGGIPPRGTAHVAASQPGLWPSPASEAPLPLRHSSPPRALELCCGTGASLAFLRSLGFSVVGVELVAAACQLAAERLTAVAGAPVAVQTINTAGADDVGIDAAVAATDTPPFCPFEALSLPAPDPGPASTPSQPPSLKSPAVATATAMLPGSRHDDPVPDAPTARILHGDLFCAPLLPGSFDFVYDCQGLHAMPPPLRPSYVAVLHAALRSGGVALLLVGRQEEEVEGLDPKLDQVLDPKLDSRTDGPSKVIDVGGGAAACSGSAVTGRKGGHMDSTEGGGAGAAAAADATATATAGLEDRQEGADQTGIAVGSGGNGRSSACAGASTGSSRGPSLMSRFELAALFPDSCWQLCSCEATRFDLTPAYARLPQPPPAWCLLVRKR